MIDPQLPGAWKEWIQTFTATSTTLAKVLADVTPAQVVASVSGENPVPGEASTRQRVLTGGQRVIDGSIASTDGTARSALLYVGRQASLFANMGTVTTTATNAINRTVGSFLADGYSVGDAIMLFGAVTGAMNGLLLVVTGVTATVLTVNGTPLTNETEAAGFRIFRVAQRTRRGVPLNSGNTDAAPAVVLLGGTQDPATFFPPDLGLSLDADGALIVSMVATISALPAQVTFHAISALY